LKSKITHEFLPSINIVTYEVIAPVHADAGPAIPWFDQPGGGTQYELSKSISQLLAENKIREI